MFVVYCVLFTVFVYSRAQNYKESLTLTKLYLLFLQI